CVSHSRSDYALRQLHSLAGVVPVGAFMLLALWANAKAADGPEAFAEALGWLYRAPLAAATLVGLPLCFHAGYGLWLTARSDYTVGRYPHSKNWMYVLQRVTGVVALVFIAFHFWRFWLPLY